MTRDEHLKWCKERAIQEYDYYVEYGSPGVALQNGMTSMMSDLTKHPETRSTSLQSLCMMQLVNKPNMTRQEFVNFINGFN